MQGPGFPIINPPQMFGGQVAVAYVIGLARQLFTIARAARAGGWPKPAGISLASKRVGLVGFGDIGPAVAKRLTACEMLITAYGPGVQGDSGLPGVQRARWPACVGKANFLVSTCALNAKNLHMLNAEVLSRCNPGVHLVNVARGLLIDEALLVPSMQSGHVGAAGLDVSESETLPADSQLRGMPQIVFGSHNGSNLRDAVRRCSTVAMQLASRSPATVGSHPAVAKGIVRRRVKFALPIGRESTFRQLRQGRHRRRSAIPASLWWQPASRSHVSLCWPLKARQTHQSTPRTHRLRKHRV